MCDVCCAEMALKKGGAVFDWAEDPQAPRGLSLHVEMTGQGSEGKGEARFRVGKDPWSPWFVAFDLACVAGFLGVDVKWAYVNKHVKDFLKGRSTSDRLIRRFKAQQAETCRHLVESCPIYTVYDSRGEAHLFHGYTQRTASLDGLTAEGVDGQVLWVAGVP